MIGTCDKQLKRLKDFLRHTKHTICRSPSNVAVKRNFEGIDNAAFDL